MKHNHYRSQIELHVMAVSKIIYVADHIVFWTLFFPFHLA